MLNTKKVIATVSRLIMSKMWLMIYHPFQRIDGGASLPQETKDKLFITSLENLEYSLLMQTEEKTKRWGWLFRTYVQWHAIAFLLSELRYRTKGELVERAWRGIEGVLSVKFGDSSGSNKLRSHLWKPLKKLMNVAKAAREEELRQERELVGQQLRQQQEFHRMDPVDPIMSVDLGVDRLYPPELVAGFGALPNGATSLWTEANIFSPAAVLPDTTLSNDHAMQGITSSANPMDLSNDPATAIPGGQPHHTDSFDSAFAATTASPDWLSSDPTGTTTTSPLLPNGNVDWENWDNLVEQFGMEVDQRPQGVRGQPWPMSSTFGGIAQWY
jgi:hypothetical protein